MLEDTWGSVTLLGAVLSAPVTIYSAAQALYLGYRKLQTPKTQTPKLVVEQVAKTAVVAKPAVVPEGAIRPTKENLRQRFDAYDAAYETVKIHRKRQAFFSITILILLSVPAFIWVPAGLYWSATATFFLFVIPSALKNERSPREHPQYFLEFPINFAYPLTFLLVSFLSAVITALAIVASLGIGTFVGLAFDSGLRSLDAIDYHVAAIVMILFAASVLNELFGQFRREDTSELKKYYHIPDGLYTTRQFNKDGTWRSITSLLP